LRRQSSLEKATAHLLPQVLVRLPHVEARLRHVHLAVLETEESSGQLPGTHTDPTEPDLTYQDEVALEEAVGDVHEDVLAILRVALHAQDLVAEPEHLDAGLVGPRQHLGLGRQLPHLVLVELDHRHVHRQLQRREQPRRRRRGVDAAHADVPPLAGPPGPAAQRPAQDLQD
jgi:hypothetical protein